MAAAGAPAPGSPQAEHFQFNFFAEQEQGQPQPGGVQQQPEQQPEQQQQEAQEQQQQQQPDEEAGAFEVAREEAVAPQEPPSEVALDSGVLLLKGRVSSEQAANMLAQPELLEGDLVPNRYEGGFKLWEGALDLVSYLIQHYQLTPALLAQHIPHSGLAGKKVLELGCGHGLPGILCLLAGATVHFQDFNSQVLTHLTLPNTAANMARLPQGALREGARFFAGDWAAVGEMLALNGLGGFYDLILSAETIYSPDSAARLLQCIKQVLQPPHGVALVAAKAYYFGVGGSTASFAQLVRDDGILEVAHVWRADDGGGNTREILRLGFPETIAPYFL